MEGLYGSINGSHMQRMLDIMKERCGLNENSHLIDIGAGLGRPLVHALLTEGIREASGYELDEIKVMKADAFIEQTARALQKKGLTETLLHLPKVHCTAIEKVLSLDPATHAYSFWEGVPANARYAFGRLFAASSTLQSVTVVQRAMRYTEDPALVMEEDYGFCPLVLIDTLTVTMSGSQRSFRAYIFNRAEAPVKQTRHRAARAVAPQPEAEVRVPTPPRSTEEIVFCEGGSESASISIGDEPVREEQQRELELRTRKKAQQQEEEQEALSPRAEADIGRRARRARRGALVGSLFSDQEENQYALADLAGAAAEKGGPSNGPRKENAAPATQKPGHKGCKGRKRKAKEASEEPNSTEAETEETSMPQPGPSTTTEKSPAKKPRGKRGNKSTLQGAEVGSLQREDTHHITRRSTRSTVSQAEEPELEKSLDPTLELPSPEKKFSRKKASAKSVALPAAAVEASVPVPREVQKAKKPAPQPVSKQGAAPRTRHVRLDEPMELPAATPTTSPRKRPAQVAAIALEHHPPQAAASPVEAPVRQQLSPKSLFLTGDAPKSPNKTRRVITQKDNSAAATLAPAPEVVAAHTQSAPLSTVRRSQRHAAQLSQLTNAPEEASPKKKSRGKKAAAGSDAQEPVSEPVVPAPAPISQALQVPSPAASPNSKLGSRPVLAGLQQQPKVTRKAAISLNAVSPSKKKGAARKVKGGARLHPARGLLQSTFDFGEAGATIPLFSPAEGPSAGASGKSPAKGTKKGAEARLLMQELEGTLWKLGDAEVAHALDGCSYPSTRHALRRLSGP